MTDFGLLEVKGDFKLSRASEQPSGLFKPFDLIHCQQRASKGLELNGKAGVLHTRNQTHFFTAQQDDAELPEEILMDILEFCDHTSLCKMGQLNKAFQRMTRDSSLWRRCYLSKWHLRHSDVCFLRNEDSWKHVLLEREALEKNWRDGRAVELDCEGHKSPVVSVSLNRKTAVSASRDKTLRVWELDSGECRHILRGHRMSVRCLKSDNCKVISGGTDRDLRIWSLNTGQCLQTLSGHDASITSLWYDPDTLTSGAVDGVIRVWDLRTGTPLQQMFGHEGPVKQLRFVDGNTLCSCADLTVRLWDLRVAPHVANIRTLRGHTARVDSLFLQQQGGDYSIVSASKRANEIRIWDIRQANAYTASIQTDVKLTSVNIHEDTIASGHQDGSIRLWGLRTGHMDAALESKDIKSAVKCLQLDRNKLVAGLSDGSICVWHQSTHTLMNRLHIQPSKGAASCLAYGNSKLVVGTTANSLLVYDFAACLATTAQTRSFWCCFPFSLPSVSASRVRRRCLMSTPLIGNAI